jgi:predicted CoA-binding protein
MSEIRRILRESRTIAVVGLSPDSSRPSFGVARFLQAKGLTIIPVNPKYQEILDLKSYPSLMDIPDQIRIDVVEVFRKSEETPEIARQAVRIGAGCLWLQLGIENEEAARIAREGGLKFVQNRCMKIEYQRLFS